MRLWVRPGSDPGRPGARDNTVDHRSVDHPLLSPVADYADYALPTALALSIVGSRTWLMQNSK